MFRWLLPLFCVLFLSFNVSAQTGTIRGFVYDKSSGEPIIFTNVYLKGTSFGASTDVNGFYQISKIEPGDYVLTVSYLGYDTISENVTVKKGQIINRKLFLSQSARNLKIVDISAESEEAKNDVKMSVEKITPRDIEKIPTVGGESDLAQYLQVLPGVVFTGDQGGQLYIRGGSPIQNKVLLDGMIVYNPFHSIGLFSVFDTDIIRNADIYTGGFGAQFGGRISSIMDITTKDGNQNEFHGNASISTFGAKLNLEGPIVRPKEVGGSNISYVLSGKHSYLNESSKLFYTYIDEDGLPFQFTDLYGKVTMSAENGSKANVFGLYFDDRVRYQAVSDLNWNNAGLGANFVLVPSSSAVLIDGNIAYSRYRIQLQEENFQDRSSEISGFNGGLNFSYFIRDDEIKWGVEIIGFSTDYFIVNESNRVISDQQNTTEIALFVKYKKKLGRLVLDPSFRLHHYPSLSNTSPEPRLGMKYNVSDKFRLKAAAGIYSQNLIAANSDRDVVNLFYGFIAGPDNLQQEFVDQEGNVRDVKHKLQKANHYIAGFELDVSKAFKINVEGYYKQFTQLTNLNRNKIFESDEIDQPEVFRKDFIIETGDAIGCDFVFKYDKNNLNLYAVYSIGRVTRWDGVQEYFPVFDRRHNVNFVSSYQFGNKRLWEFNARWNMGSGFPFTQTLGFYEQFDFNDGTNSNIISGNGEVGILYDELNGGRLPYYHRLDVTLKRKFVLSVNSTIEANVGVTNAYNRENIFYFDRVNFERVNQLPMMPSAGISWSF